MDGQSSCIDKVNLTEALDVAANSLSYTLQAFQAGCDNTVSVTEHEIRNAYDGTVRRMAARSEWDRTTHRFVSEVDVKNPRAESNLEILIAREVARLKVEGHDIDV